MKVRIMDYETAKAEVLVRGRNPSIANDSHVFGIKRTWEGWGQVRDIYKNKHSFRDKKDNYELPNYLIADVTAEDVLRYGEVIINEEFIEYGPIRIRIISYNGSIYYHKMVNGEIIECKEIGLAMK